MSTIPLECFLVESVFIRLRLKWIVKLKDIEALSSKAVSAVHSNLYKFKPIQDLSFCFCLEHPKISYYSLSVKGSNRWSFQVMNPFVVIKDRAYGLKPYTQQAFLDFFDATCIKDIEEYVEVHSVVNICPANPHDFFKDESYLLEVPDVIHCESFTYLHLPHRCTNDMVIDFLQKGDIPKLNVDVAIEIIKEAMKHYCNVLKILCVEYLMNNVTSANFEEILEFAQDLHLWRLENRCNIITYTERF